MATTAKTSEAQRIVDDLIDRFGMAGAAIAREIGVKADTIQNIKGRRATGNLQLQRLRMLRDQMMSAVEQPNTPQNREPDARPLFEQMPSVAEMLKPVQEDDDPARFDVNADDRPEEPKKTLREKAGDLIRDAMLGRVTVDAAPPPKSRKSSDGKVTPKDLAEQLTPIIAAFVVLGADWLIRDPYKPIAPTDQEAYAIFYPIVKRLARKVEAQRELTEDDLELLGMALAITAYGRRARSAYKAIHAQEVEHARSNGHGASGARSADIPGFTTQSPADDSAGRSRARSATPVPFAARPDGRDRQPGSAADGAVSSPDERRANSMLTALLDADAEGRKQLGLG